MIRKAHAALLLSLALVLGLLPGRGIARAAGDGVYRAAFAAATGS